MNAVLDERKVEGWKADLSLAFRSDGQRTSLARRAHRGPLLVQRAFHPDADVCHSYVIHPPGGVVGGDELRLGVSVEPGAHALVTTPGATRCYRSGLHRRALLEQDLAVTAGSLEWLPQETIVFDGADVRSSTHVMLDRQSRFIGWEILCLGRPESAAPFRQGRVHLNLRLSLDATPVFLDRLRIGESSCPRGLEPLHATWGMRGREAFGTLLAFPGNEDCAAAVRDVSTPLVDAATSVVDGVLHCRAAAAQGESIRRHFVALWQVLRPLVMQRAAVAPRIWAT